MPIGLIAIAALAVIVLLIIISNIHIVQQSRAYVIERLGAFSKVWQVGIHVKVPFIERVAKKVSLKEQVLDYPPAPGPRAARCSAAARGQKGQPQGAGARLSAAARHHQG